MQHAHNLKTLIETTVAKAYLVNTATVGAEDAVAAATAGKAAAAVIKKNAVTEDAIRRVSLFCCCVGDGSAQLSVQLAKNLGRMRHVRSVGAC